MLYAGINWRPNSVTHSHTPGMHPTLTSGNYCGKSTNRNLFKLVFQFWGPCGRNTN